MLGAAETERTCWITRVNWHIRVSHCYYCVTPLFYLCTQRKWLVSRYFESSQPQRITSGLKINFSLSPNYSAHKSSNHKFSLKSTQSALRQIYVKQYIHTLTSNTKFLKKSLQYCCTGQNKIQKGRKKMKKFSKFHLQGVDLLAHGM